MKNIIGTYLNNTTSFSFDRPDLIEEFFNVEDMNCKLEKIMNDLYSEYYSGKSRQHALQGLIELQNVFESEMENYDYGEIDPLLSSEKKLKLGKFLYELKNKLKEINKKDRLAYVKLNNETKRKSEIEEERGYDESKEDYMKKRINESREEI